MLAERRDAEPQVGRGQEHVEPAAAGERPYRAGREQQVEQAAARRHCCAALEEQIEDYPEPPSRAAAYEEPAALAEGVAACRDRLAEPQEAHQAGAAGDQKESDRGARQRWEPEDAAEER